MRRPSEIRDFPGRATCPTNPATRGTLVARHGNAAGFRSGLTDFAGGSFTEGGGGGDGMDAGLLTHGPGMATSLEMKSLSPQNEAEPQPEPEPEGTHSWR